MTATTISINQFIESKRYIESIITGTIKTVDTMLRIRGFFTLGFIDMLLTFLSDIFMLNIMTVFISRSYF